MSDTISLIKANPLLPAEDYAALRKQGFKMIEKLGRSNWTDYNNSDPGITILEAVCYAITDLAYRTGFEVKDILAPQELTEDTWKQVFYTARQILHNGPLTINDYRKLIIDVKGVRNAWIEPSKDYEVPIWVDYMAYDLRENLDCYCEDAGTSVCYGKLRLGPADLTQVRRDEQKAFKDAVSARIQALTEKISANKSQNGLQVEAWEKETAFLQTMNRTDGNYQPPNYPKTNLDLKILELEGLYNVMVEYEEDVIEEDQRETVRQQVIARLSRNRNLCEDFLNVTAVDYLDFGLKASIELEDDADPDRVLAQIFFTIYKYFTPSIPFHTIDEMLKGYMVDGVFKQYVVDEIFEGPALKHGFIDTTELEKTDLFRDIRLSDIIKEITDIGGIKGILYLHLPFEGFNKEDAGKDYFNAWVAELREERKIARIQPDKSQVIFCKERELVSYYTGRSEDRRPDRMLKLFRDLKASERKYKLKGHTVDFPVPVGEYMQLTDYFPVTESLPMCYGVSRRAGLPGDDEAKRKAQVLQLKGYLLFFEQMMAGYLIQLSHLRDLFTFDDSVKHTYFAFDTREKQESPDDRHAAEHGGKSKYRYVSHWLKEIHELQALLIDHEQGRYEEHGNSDAFEGILNRFIHTVQNLLETPEIFGTRRNDFLDHMLARFSEDLSEYERIMRWLMPRQVEERLIRDKARLLQDGEYYRISSGRGRGYDYAQPGFWDTGNVSGTERRVGRLLGFSDISRRTLAPESIVSEAVMVADPTTKQPALKKNAKGDPLNVIKLFDPADQFQLLLISIEVADGCCTEQLMNEILRCAGERKNYRLREGLKPHSRKTAAIPASFWFELWDGVDPETAVLLGVGEHFNNKELRDEAFHRLLAVMEAIDANEGFHLVEHILLRPKFDEVFDEAGKPISVSFPLICLDNCDLGIGLDERKETPLYRKRIHRIPAVKCYDKMPWVLEYIRYDSDTNTFGQSILWQSVPIDGSEPMPMKFRRYEHLARRVRDLQEFGAERANYEIVSNQQADPAKLKYGFIIRGERDAVLAQIPFIFKTTDEIKAEIESLMSYFEFELDLYGQANPCDNNEDPYSFRATAVLPCWPKRFCDPAFRNLVEKTIQTESPAHVHVRTVWLGVQEMQRFERVYCDWLLEMSETEMPSIEITNALVDVLNTLRPCGVCEDECD